MNHAHKSLSLIERDRQCLWHPFTQHWMQEDLLIIKEAAGAHLYLEDNAPLLDAISSWWCNLHGHGHPDLVHAAKSQFETLDHVLFAGCTHEPAITLAEDLLRATSGHFERVFYSDNGSTAVEVALKMAIQWWYNQGRQRTTILALYNSYHGDTFGAMATGARGLFTAPFDSMLFDVAFLPTDGSQETLDYLEKLCLNQTIAAFIYEPLVQGAGGMLMYSKDTLNTYTKVCKTNGIPCIADEVMTGFGRTGPLFASLELDSPPDIICLSKGLTNGSIPLSATLCSRQIYEAFVSPDHSKTLFHGHTFTGNPIACAIARKSLELTLSEQCSTQRTRIARQHAACAQTLSAIPTALNTRHLGTILAFDLKTDGQTSYTNAIKGRIMSYFRDRGILIRPLGNTIYCLPPYCTTEGELEHIHSAMIDCAHVFA